MPLGLRPRGLPLAIIIRREGLTFTILRYLPVRGQAVPPGLVLPRPAAGRGFAGFWYELLDRQGGVLYRATGKDPLGASVEFPGEDGVQRVKASAEPVEFRLLVPRSVAIDGAQLRIFSLETAIYEHVDPGKPVAELPVNITEDDINDHR